MTIVKGIKSLDIIRVTIRKYCYGLNFSSSKDKKFFKVFSDIESFSTYELYNPAKNKFYSFFNDNITQILDYLLNLKAQYITEFKNFKF